MKPGLTTKMVVPGSSLDRCVVYGERTFQDQLGATVAKAVKERGEKG
jgi:hypothetical protein